MPRAQILAIYANRMRQAEQAQPRLERRVGARTLRDHGQLRPASLRYRSDARRLTMYDDARLAWRKEVPLLAAMGAFAKAVSANRRVRLVDLSVPHGRTGTRAARLHREDASTLMRDADRPDGRR